INEPSGTITKSSGVLAASLFDPTVNEGTISVPAGQTIVAGSGFTNAATGVVEGAGAFVVSSATTTNVAGSTYGNVTLSSGGTMTGTTTVTGSLAWNGGSFAGAGTTTIAAGATASI